MNVDKIQYPIFRAVKDGDLQQVKRYLAEGIDVDIRDKVNSTPLSWASSCGHLEMVKYLAEHGADINSQYDAGNTPLIVASWQGHLTGSAISCGHWG